MQKVTSSAEVNAESIWVGHWKHLLLRFILKVIQDVLLDKGWGLNTFSPETLLKLQGRDREKIQSLSGNLSDQLENAKY